MLLFITPRKNPVENSSATDSVLRIAATMPASMAGAGDDDLQGDGSVSDDNLGAWAGDPGARIDVSGSPAHGMPRRWPKASMPAEHKSLDRKHQRLDPQDHGVDEADSIDRVKSKAPRRADIPGGDQVVVAGIGVGDATAAGRHAFEPALVERLQEDQDGSRLGHLLRIDQLLAAAELAGGDEVLHLRDHHRDDRPRLRDAGDFGHHADLHDLRFDLPEAGLQASPPGAFRDQDPGRTHHRVDDVADAQRELLHASADAGADDGLAQIDLGLRQGRFGAGLLGGEK